MNLQNDKPQQERAYLEMLRPALQRLAGKNPAQVAALAGGSVSEDVSTDGNIRISTMGQEVTVSLKTGDIHPQLENWHSLVLLHYLDNSDGTLPTGRWISFEDMKDGLVRGTKFSHASSQWLGRFLTGKTIGQVQERCEQLGGHKVGGKGDLSMNLPFLPHFPVLLNVWEADEDFPATGKMLIDACADHYLSIEDAVTVGEIVQRRLSMSV